MWRFDTASASPGPVDTLNDNVGRQTWRFDTSASSASAPSSDADFDRRLAAVDAARERFAASSATQKHSSDELLRQQALYEAEKEQGLPPLSSTPAVAAIAASRRDASSPDDVRASLEAGASYFSRLQRADGHWAGDYGGPMFLLPGMIIACHVTGVLAEVFPTPQHVEETLRYLTLHQNAKDGGYGLHIEGHSTMFCTVLNYVSLRILGVPADDERCVRARKWIRDRGGATRVASWGKFWLSLLDCYSWEGVNPMPPEAWLLPHSKWTGVGWIHPGRYWCHCRMVYLPMSYLYGARCRVDGGRSPGLVAALREELFVEPGGFGSIDWDSTRNSCAEEDLYYPHPRVQDALWWAMARAERLLAAGRGSGFLSSLVSFPRRRALERVAEHVAYEDEQTRHICIGPVNKVVNMMVRFFHDGPDSEGFRKHVPRLQDYLWVAEDGLKMQGYNGSQLWDTAFAIQALGSCGDDLAKSTTLPGFATTIRKAMAYVDASQVRENNRGPLEKWYRHISKGAWPFSTRDHGWPISDCSAEGLKATLVAKKLGGVCGFGGGGGGGAEGEGGGENDLISEERLSDCVNVILSYQNPEGGWATYENRRSSPLLELINPSETFGDIVIDYSYVECSSACVTALSAFTDAFPSHPRGKEIARALARGKKYILGEQRADGSWYGSWGVCFTYGAWFGCEALSAMGETAATCPALRRACEFLVSKQNADGGWGESYLSSMDKVYSGAETQVVNTAWALLALLKAGWHEVDDAGLAAVRAGAGALLRAQLSDGDWPQERISGVFNRSCMISYTNYRNIFPIWALGEYRRRVLLIEEEGKKK